MLTRWSEELTVLTNDSFGTVSLDAMSKNYSAHHTLFSPEIYFRKKNHILMKMSFMQKQIHILMEKHGLKHGISGMLLNH